MKWNKLNVTAKSKVEACRVGEGKTGQCNNPAVVIEYEEMLIMAADRSTSNSDWMRGMFENNLSFSGISVAVDHFKHQFEVLYLWDQL